MVYTFNLRKIHVSLIGVFLALSTQAEVCKNLKITPSIISTYNRYYKATKDYENLGPEAFVNSMALTILDSKFMISLLKGLPPLPKLSWDQKEFWILRLRDKNKTALLDFCNLDDNEVSVNGYKFKISEKMSLEEMAQFLEPLFPKQNNIGFLLWIQNQIIPSAEAVTVMGGAMIGALAGLAGMLLMNVFKGNSSSKTQSQPASRITVSDVGTGGSLPVHAGAGAAPSGGTPGGAAPGEAPADGQNPAGANPGTSQPNSPNGGAAGPGGAKPNATPNAPSANNGETQCSHKTTPIAEGRKAQLNALSEDQIKNFQCFSKYHEFGNKSLQVAQWNDGEDWLSLGVGHYIWYPKEGEKKYTESFPDLIKFACSNGYTGSLPKEIGYTGGNPVLGVCPWNSKKEFEDPKTKNSDELKNIQNFLLDKEMQKQQALFQYNRLLDFMENWKPKNDVEVHAKEFADRLMKYQPGLLQMIDYVNFKGEGTAPNEKYTNKEGKEDRLGLKQVLETAVNEGGLEFIDAAKRTLNRKINTDPKICEKHTNPEECKKDLKAGWEKRINDYSNISTAQSKYNCK